MTRRDFETLLLTLESTPALVARAAASLSPAEARVRPAAGRFSFIENVWHLAEPEREGYGTRIERILGEENPALANFDGERVARERGYQDRDVERGLALFASARQENLGTLRALSAADWKRSGAQEGVGCVTLADLPRMMAEHDRSHEIEISDLLALLRGKPLAERPHPTSAVA